MAQAKQGGLENEHSFSPLPVGTQGPNRTVMSLDTLAGERSEVLGFECLRAYYGQEALEHALRVKRDPGATEEGYVSISVDVERGCGVESPATERDREALEHALRVKRDPGATEEGCGSISLDVERGCGVESPATERDDTTGCRIMFKKEPVHAPDPIGRFSSPAVGALSAWGGRKLRFLLQHVHTNPYNGRIPDPGLRHAMQRLALAAAVTKELHNFTGNPDLETMISEVWCRVVQEVLQNFRQDIRDYDDGVEKIAVWEQSRRRLAQNPTHVWSHCRGPQSPVTEDAPDSPQQFDNAPASGNKMIVLHLQ